MTHRCVIISGGSYAPVEGVREDDFVIACDKGYVYAQQAGVRPNLLVGILTLTRARCPLTCRCGATKRRRTTPIP